jgi:serine protease AprX
MSTLAIYKTTLRTSSLLVAVLLLAISCSAGEKNLSPELHAQLAAPQRNPGELVDVIIQFRPGAHLPDKIAAMLGLGAKHRAALDVINGGLFRIPAGLLSILSQDPDILYITPDRKLKRTSPEDYVLDATQANYIFQYGYYGNGIGIAVIDSGIRASHPDLQNLSTGASRVIYSQSFVPGTDANDAYGHGTHVAGLLAGNGQASGGWMRGIAQKANLINLRVLDANGAGTDSQVIAAIQQAISLKNAYNIRVINLSLGRPISESYTMDPLCQAVEQAWKAGIVVVVAAGNSGRDDSMGTDGYATISAPGNDPYVITVGAVSTHGTDTTLDDTLASYSSKGPTLVDHVVKPDIVAPGNRLVSLIANGSTLDTNHPADEVPPSEYGSYSSTSLYFRLSGTSMAAPLVSGTVALMLQRIPSLTPDQVKIRLMKTATKTYPAYTSATAASNGAYYSIQNDVFGVGAGYLNTYNAVASNELPAGNSLSPTATRTALGVVLTPNALSAWANSITWGASIVWGNNVLQANSIIWGSSIVWGDQTDSGYSIVWSDSIVWGVDGTTFSESGDSDNN